MASSSQSIRRLSTTSGGVITRGPGGQGTKNVTVPPMPDPPTSMSSSEKAKWVKDWGAWRAALQAQFPIPE